MNGRGTYGSSRIVVAERGGSSAIWWIAAVGGVALWARHQSKQVGKLHQATGLPRQSFLASTREDAERLVSATRARLHDLGRRLPARSGT